MGSEGICKYLPYMSEFCVLAWSFLLVQFVAY